MGDPRVPGASIELACGEHIDPARIDLGMRELSCPCGSEHAVVTDVHPPSRFVPEATVEILRETVEPADEQEVFSTTHVMGMVLEEFPEAVATHDATEDGTVGYAMVWVTDMDARTLHEIVVELLVELMDHAVSHAEDPETADRFQRQLESFDIETFVSAYREAREFEVADDRSA